MLIVRGVNVPFGSARSRSAFAPRVSGQILVKPQAAGARSRRFPCASSRSPRDRGRRAAEAIREKLRNVLVVQTHIELVPSGSPQRSEYKSKLVEH